MKEVAVKKFRAYLIIMYKIENLHLEYVFSKPNKKKESNFNKGQEIWIVSSIRGDINSQCEAWRDSKCH